MVLLFANDRYGRPCVDVALEFARSGGPPVTIVFAGQPQMWMWKYVTSDSGLRFSGTVLTSSTGLQLEPVCVRGASRVVWDYGTWTTYTNYSVGIKTAA